MDFTAIKFFLLAIFFFSKQNTKKKNFNLKSHFNLKSDEVKLMNFRSMYS